MNQGSRGFSTTFLFYEVNSMNVDDQSRQRENLQDSVIDQLIATNPTLTRRQIDDLRNTLNYTLARYSVSEDENNASIIEAQQDNARVLRMFIDAKRVEGRSDTTLYNYAKEISKIFLSINKSYKYITTKDIREYMSWRKDVGCLKNTSIANMRQYLMSFFKWCYREELIVKNPMDRIGVVKQDTRVIQVLTDEEQEIIRCACECERDRALVDLLAGSGMRVGELIGINREDVNFQEGTVRVFGKGAKERICYLTARCKVHLKWYLEERDDDNPALFVTDKKPHERLTKGGVEYILRKIAKKSAVPTIHLYPHKYRSTLATTMLNKGADIDTISHVLGHTNVAVTAQHYARAENEHIKFEHKKYANQ